jgi:hypothetical protein
LIVVNVVNGCLRERLAWSLMCGFAILAVAFAVWTYAHPRGSGAGPVLAFVPPPRDTHFLAFGFGSGPAVVSPDETKLAFTVIDQNGLIKLWTRSLRANDASAVPGTEGAAVLLRDMMTGTIVFVGVVYEP